MVRLTARQRGALAATMRELANYGVAAMVFGQFIGEVTCRGGGSSQAWRCGLHV